MGQEIKTDSQHEHSHLYQKEVFYSKRGGFLLTYCGSCGKKIFEVELEI